MNFVVCRMIPYGISIWVRLGMCAWIGDGFVTFQKCSSEEYLYIGNNSTIILLGKGSVELVFTSGNLLLLKEVMYTPNIARNLVLRPTLNRMGYILVFESDRCVISKGCIYRLLLFKL